MSIVKVKEKYQIVIPEDARKKLGVNVGDMLDIEEKGGRLILKPVIVVDKSQAWFWTPEWQKAEREADDDIKAGRVSGPFTKADDLIAHLRKRK